MKAVLRAYGIDEPPAAISHLDGVLDLLAPWPRRLLERVVERIIDRFDEEDGDPDMELNGDEIDGSGAEDELTGYVWDFRCISGPACSISDPG